MTQPWAVNPLSALIVGAPPRYRFVTSQIPPELVTWASGAGVVLFMVDLWYLDSTIPRYIWEAIATVGGTPAKIKGLYTVPSGVSIYQIDYISGGAQVTTEIGADSTLDSATLFYSFKDAFVSLDATSSLEWDPLTSFPSAGWFYSHTVYTTATGTIDFAPFSAYRGVVWEFLGGGGAGGSCAASGGAGSSACGGGGGAGGYGRCQVEMSAILAATSDGLIDITIGAAGAAGAAGNNPGGNGGDTIISGDLSGTLVQATGGSGGEGGAASTAVGISQGGDGGVESYPGIVGSHLNYDASRGGNGFRVPGGGAIGGTGGASFYGGLQRGNATDGGGNGIAGIGFGSGGSGAHDNPAGNAARTGGAGIQGYVLTHIFR